MGLEEVPPYEELEIRLDCHGACGRKNLPSSEFTRRKDVPRGFQYECKECRRALDVDRRKRLREQIESKGKRNNGKSKPKEKKPRSGPSNKLKHRQEIREDAGLKIGLRQPIADTARGLHFRLKLVLEDQLGLYYQPKVRTIPGKVRAAQLLDLATFAISAEISRFVDGVASIMRDENTRINIDEQAALLKEKLAAYTILGLSPGVGDDVVKHKYRQLASRAHPDRGGSKEAMQRLNAAYAILTEKANGRNGNSYSEYEGEGEEDQNGDGAAPGEGAG